MVAAIGKFTTTGLIAGLLAVSACADVPTSRTATGDDGSARDCTAEIRQVDEFLKAASQGQVSQFGLGMFVYVLLGEASAKDEELARYIERDDGDAASYLRNVFARQPAQEVAAVEAMAARGHHDQRLAVGYALESLSHIPDGDDAPDIQARDRGELAGALTRLKGVLRDCAVASAPADR